MLLVVSMSEKLFLTAWLFGLLVFGVLESREARLQKTFRSSAARRAVSFSLTGVITYEQFRKRTRVMNSIQLAFLCAMAVLVWVPG